MRIVDAATASQKQWYAMLWCFFFKNDYGVDTFLYTDSLSQNTLVGPSMETPNMRSLYRRASTSSTAFFNAVNFLPNVLVSTVFLPFTEWNDWSFVNENKYPCLWLSSHLVTRMIGIYKTMRRYGVTTGLRHIWRNHFLHTFVEILPVKLMESIDVNLRVARIKSELAFWIFLEISKNMENLFQMSYTWWSKVSWQ